MKLIKDLNEQIHFLEATDDVVCLATLFQTKGSSYLKAGARKLIFKNRDSHGLISGGCLESDMITMAVKYWNEGMHNQTFDTSEEEDRYLGSGVGCAGELQVRFEYLKFSELKSRSVEHLAYSTEPSEGYIHNIWQVGQQTCKKRVIEASELKLFCQDQGIEIKDPIIFKKIDQQFHFIEPLQSPIQLYVFGCGVDAEPMVQLAFDLGWDVFAMDYRGELVKDSRFPKAKSLDYGKPENLLEKIHFSSNKTAILLMSHSFAADLEMFKGIYDKDFFYLGLLGPMQRMHLLLEDLKKFHSIEVEPETLKKIQGPMGIPLMGHGPEVVAMSTLADVLKRHNEQEVL